MSKTFKGGISNPLNLKAAEFKYEVEEELSDVIDVEYEEYGEKKSYPEKKLLISTLNGGSYLRNEFVVTVILYDALKHYRKGEMISADLRFRAGKDNDGNYRQHVYAENIYTLNDYRQICEAESFYNGSVSKKDEPTD